MIVHRIALIYLLCISTFYPLLAQENTITVTENEYLYGGSKIAKYSGSINSWNYSQIIEALNEFEPLKSNHNSGVPTAAVNWVYFKLSNPDSLALWLNTGSSRLNEIRVYYLDENNNAIDSIYTGISAGKDYRTIWTYKLILPILKRNQKSGRILMGYYADNGLNEISFCFGTKDQLANEAYYGNVYSLMFTGLYLLLFLYNLILAWTIRDKIYLLYSLNILAIFFTTTYAVHFPFIEIFIGEQITQNYVAAWFPIMPILMTLFTTEFFNLKKSSPFWYRMLWIGAGLMVLNSLSMLFLSLDIPTGIALVLITIFYSFCALIGFDQIQKKHPLAWLYFISWIIILIGLILYITVAQLGVFYSELFYYGNFLTGSIEALLFSIALGWRYQLIVKREKETSALLAKKNETLSMANESLDTFNYHVNHDLKAILANTLGLSHMIKKYTLKNQPEKVVEISDKLTQVTQKGQETIAGFLSLAEAGKIKDDVQEEIEFVRAFQELIMNNGLESINVKYDKKEFEWIRFNPTAFNSIFLNLLTNSVKYTTKDPEVNVSLKKQGRTIQIIYSDNGIGVDLEKDQDLLFSPFRRVENNLEKEGSGIGLFLVKRIISHYNGVISPSSAPGKGLTFTISFPKDMMVEKKAT